MMLQICRICFVALLVVLLYQQSERLEHLECQNKQLWHSVSRLQLHENSQNDRIEELESDVQIQQLQQAVGNLQQRIGKLEVTGK